MLSQERTHRKNRSLFTKRTPRACKRDREGGGVYSSNGIRLARESRSCRPQKDEQRLLCSRQESSDTVAQWMSQALESLDVRRIGTICCNSAVNTSAVSVLDVHWMIRSDQDEVVQDFRRPARRRCKGKARQSWRWLRGNALKLSKPQPCQSQGTTLGNGLSRQRISQVFLQWDRSECHAKSWKWIIAREWTSLQN